jgi:hypothetical protein
LINYTLAGIDEKYYLRYPGFYGAKWAEPDLADLKNKLQMVIKDQKLSQKKALKAKHEVTRFNDIHVSEYLIKRLSDPLLQQTQSSGSPQLFERLMPLYYPALKKKDIHKISRSDFKKKIKSVLIVGTGYRARKAFDYIFYQSGIKNIFFLDNNLMPYSNNNFSSLYLKNARDIKEKVEIVVLAVNIKHLSQIYFSFINIIDSIPVYIFD